MVHYQELDLAEGTVLLDAWGFSAKSKFIIGLHHTIHTVMQQYPGMGNYT